MPERIGAYDVDRLIGAGSFATIWLAHHPVLGGHVAIKVLADNWSHDLRVRERFLEEGACCGASTTSIPCASTASAR